MRITPKPKKSWTIWRKNNETYFQFHLSQLDKRKKLVDLGAGNCEFAKLFKKFNYTGIDFHPYPGVIVQDITKGIQWENDSVDIITMSNTLEHLPNPQFILEECNRILNSGGIIVGAVPFLVGEHQQPYDFFRYTRFQLEIMLNQAGFKEISISPLGNLWDVHQDLLRAISWEIRKTEINKTLKFRIWRKSQNVMLAFARKYFGNIQPKSFIMGFGFKGTK